jgi:hypothetical protein
MKKETKLIHVGLTYQNRKEAEIFFKNILGLNHTKSFTLSKKINCELFGENEETIIDVYSNDYSYFEIFISKNNNKQAFNHTCIKVNNKKEFIKRCRENNINPIFIKKGEKTLLFVRDYADNLFEIIE